MKKRINQLDKKKINILYIFLFFFFCRRDIERWGKWKNKYRPNQEARYMINLFVIDGCKDYLLQSVQSDTRQKITGCLVKTEIVQSTDQLNILRCSLLLFNAVVAITDPQITGGPCKIFDDLQENWDIISIFMTFQIKK